MINKTKLLYIVYISIIIYGVITFSVNIGFDHLLTIVLINLISIVALYKCWKYISKNNNRIKPFDWIGVLIALGVILIFNIQLEKPVDAFVKPYDIILVPTGEASDKSFSSEMWITKLSVDNKTLDLKDYDYLQGWEYKDQGLVNFGFDVEYLTFKDIRNETVEVQLLKSAYSGKFHVYQDNNKIRTFDLYNETSKAINIIVSKDHLVLLIPAYIGLIAAFTIIANAILILINNFYLKLCKKNKLTAKYCSKVIKLEEFKKNISVYTYMLLPLYSLYLFRYVAKFPLLYKGFSFGVILLLVLGLEVYALKKIKNNQELYSKYKSLLDFGRINFYIITCSLIMVVLLELIYFFPNFEISMNWLELYTSATFLTVSIISAIIYVLYSLFNNIFISIGLAALVFMTFGIANFYKLKIIGEPIYPADLAMLTKIQDIIGYVKDLLSVNIIFILVALIALIIFLSVKYPGIKINKKTRLTLLVISIVYTFSVFNYDQTFMKPIVHSAASIVKLKWNQLGNYEQNGAIIGFISNLQTDLMVKNKEYTEHRINQIMEQYSKETDVVDINSLQKPNIVIIMSESLSDPTVMEQLTFSEDPLPYLKEVQKQSLSGNLLSPFRGSKTANIEFEFFTSFSNAFMVPGSIPFQQTLSNKENFPSFAAYLKELGYATTAIHPNNPSMYKRNLVYPTIGFDHFIGINELTYTDRILNNFYISDQAVMDEVLLALKEESDPAFVYALTIANHMPIVEDKFGETMIEVRNKDNERNEEVEIYSQGLKISDESLRKFMTELENFEEPTVVVFFGDHTISFQSNVHQDHGYVAGDKNAENAKKFYQTPLFMWSNTGQLPYEPVGDVSPNFLAPLLIEALDFPMTPYYQMVLDVYQQISVIHPDFIIDKDANQIYNRTIEQTNLLLDYELIEYDLIDGKDYSKSQFFNIKTK